MNSKELLEISSELRIDIMDMIYKAGSGHIGGSFSCIDIITYLYFEKMNIDAKAPERNDRDRFILSKGHVVPAVYATLAKKGFFDKEILSTLRQTGSILQGHPDARKVPGIDISTGSLGQGFSNAVGIAMALKMEKSQEKVYVIVGDGEIQEGIIWEGAMCASKYKLDNLRVIIDYNKLQLDGKVEDIMDISPIKEKWESFGFYVAECDGHNFDEIHNAFNECEKIKDKPSVIIAHTVKGKGVSFMEHKAEWHGVAPNKEQYNDAIKELKGGY